MKIKLFEGEFQLLLKSYFIAGKKTKRKVNAKYF